MQRYTELQAKVENLEDLLQIVGAMRSIAAVRLQEARAALAGVRNFSTSIDAGLQYAKKLAPQRPSEPPNSAPGISLILTFLSEHGFVGGYNAAILDHVTKVKGQGDPQIVVIGNRGAAVAAERGFVLSGVFTAPSHVSGALPLARHLTEEVYKRLSSVRIETLVLCHARPGFDGEWRPVADVLLPLSTPPHDAAAPGIRPLIQLSPERLLSALLDEWLFAQIMCAQIEAFTCENSARLAAMESIHASVTRKTDQFSQMARTRRQDEITTELIDIVVGSAAAGHRI